MYDVPNKVDWSFLLGKALEQVCFGLYDVQLRFHGDICITMNIDDPLRSFQHKTTHSTSSTVGGTPGGSIGLVSLLGASVEQVVVENSRTLALYFTNQEELRIYETGDGYESYTISGPNLSLIVV